MAKDYEKYREKYLEYAKKRRNVAKTDPLVKLQKLLYNAKARAKEKGLPFDITIEDIKLNTICPVLNIPLLLIPDEYGNTDASYSIDRIDNSKGYVKGNVRIISNKANKLKNKMTKEECQLLIENWDKI